MRLPNTIEKGDRITAAEYANRRGLAVKVLTEPGRAIDLVGRTGDRFASGPT